MMIPSESKAQPFDPDRLVADLRSAVRHHALRKAILITVGLLAVMAATVWLLEAMQ